MIRVISVLDSRGLTIINQLLSRKPIPGFSLPLSIPPKPHALVQPYAPGDLAVYYHLLPALEILFCGHSEQSPFSEFCSAPNGLHGGSSTHKAGKSTQPHVVEFKLRHYILKW